MDKIKRICIIDEYLKNYTGHYLMEAINLMKAGNDLNMKVDVTGSVLMEEKIKKSYNIQASFPDTSNAVPFLVNLICKYSSIFKKVSSKSRKIFHIGTTPAPSNHFPPKKRTLSLKKKSVFCYLQKDMYLEKPYLKFMKNFEYDRNSVYLFKSCSPTIIIAVIRGMVKYNLKHKCIFYSHIPFHQTQITRINELLDQLSSCNVSHKPCFFWSSRIHVERHRQMGLKEAELLPVVISPVQTRAKEIPTKDSLSLCFLGNAQQLRGFALLPGLIDRIRMEFPSKDIVFNIQYSPVPGQTEPDDIIEATYEKLKKKNINLIPGALDTAAYFSVLDKSDIILLPYKIIPDVHYATGSSSGILIEALARAKVVIVPGNTWLSRQVEKFDSGKCFNGDDDFYKKTLQAINEYDTLKAIAEKNKDYWRHEHSPQKIMRTILNEFTENQL